MTFEQIRECVLSINEMEEIFKGIAIVACHQNEIEVFQVCADRTKELLATDVRRNKTDVKKVLAHALSILIAMVLGYLIAQI